MPIFLIIGVGYLAAHFKIVSQADNASIGRFVLNFTIPSSDNRGLSEPPDQTDPQLELSAGLWWRLLCHILADHSLQPLCAEERLLNRRDLRHGGLRIQQRIYRLSGGFRSHWPDQCHLHGAQFSSREYRHHPNGLDLGGRRQWEEHQHFPPVAPDSLSFDKKPDHHRNCARVGDFHFRAQSPPKRSTRLFRSWLRFPARRLCSSSAAHW